MMPKVIAGTTSVAVIMVFIGPRMSSITNANTRKKSITGIRVRNTTRSTTVKSMPVTINTSHHTIRGPTVEIITVAIRSRLEAGAP
jgi:hypothetical protein